MSRSPRSDTGKGLPAAAEPTADGPVAPGAPTPGGARKRAPRSLTLALVAVAAAAVIVASVVIVIRDRPNPLTQAPRPSGIPADISTSLANLMQLGPVAGPAPDFTLTDQAGRTMSLSSLRGKVVVLEFMDPHCTDICPIVSQEFVDAYHDLGPLAGKVVFAAVNVNQYYHSVANVAAFSREHQLTTIPGWHFFTGAVPALQAVWRSYEIDVQAPNPNADIVHTSAVYFINPQGREAFLASPMVDHTAKGAAYLPMGQITDWGKGIALVARHLAG